MPRLLRLILLRRISCNSSNKYNHVSMGHLWYCHILFWRLDMESRLMHIQLETRPSMDLNPTQNIWLQIFPPNLYHAYFLKTETLTLQSAVPTTLSLCCLSATKCYWHKEIRSGKLSVNRFMICNYEVVHCLWIHGWRIFLTPIKIANIYSNFFSQIL